MRGIGLGLGLGQGWTAAAGPPPVWQERGIVAARMSLPLAEPGRFPNAEADTEIYEQSRYVLAVDAEDCSLLLSHIGNEEESGLGIGSYTAKASLFRGPMWGPYDRYVIAKWAGGSDDGMRSPPIVPGEAKQSQVTSFGGSAGAAVLVRRHLIFATAPSHWPGSQIGLTEGDEVNAMGAGLPERISPGNTAPSNDWAGTVYTRDGALAYCHAAPPLLLGRAETRRARVCILNDSIGMGAGDGGEAAYAGWPARLLGADWPWYLAGNAGLSLAALMADEDRRDLRLGTLAAAGVTHLLLQAISNDIGAGRAAEQFLADAELLRRDVVALGIRLVLATSTPRTDADNTTPRGTDMPESWSRRLLLNQAIRDGNGVGHGYLDAALHSQAEGEANRWSVVAGRGTADGLHPNAATHAHIAAQLAEEAAELLNVAHFA